MLTKKAYFKIGFLFGLGFAFAAALVESVILAIPLVTYMLAGVLATLTGLLKGV